MYEYLCVTLSCLCPHSATRRSEHPLFHSFPVYFVSFYFPFFFGVDCWVYCCLFSSSHAPLLTVLTLSWWNSFFLSTHYLQLFLFLRLFFLSNFYLPFSSFFFIYWSSESKHHFPDSTYSGILWDSVAILLNGVAVPWNISNSSFPYFLNVVKTTYASLFLQDIHYFSSFLTEAY